MADSEVEQLLAQKDRLVWSVGLLRSMIEAFCEVSLLFHRARDLSAYANLRNFIDLLRGMLWVYEDGVKEIEERLILANS